MYKVYLMLPPPTLGMLLACCLVRARDKVLNQGARSVRETIVLIVSRGSPATMGRGGTTLPS